MRANVRLDEAAPEGERDGLRAVLTPSFERMCWMCVATVFELMTRSPRDLNLRPSFREQPEDLALARAEARSRRACPFPFIRVDGRERRSDRLTRARSSPGSRAWR